MGWEKAIELAITAAVTLLAAFVGAYFGAKFAFDMNERAKQREETDRRIAAINRALFILAQQLNVMVNIKRQHLDPVRDDGARHINMRPITPEDRSDLQLQLEGLDFLLATKYHQTIMDLMLADSWFRKTIKAVNWRYHVHHDLAQPKLESVQFTAGPRVPLPAAEVVLGLQLASDLRQTTDAVYHFVEQGCERHEKLSLRLWQEMKELYPGHQFIRAALPAGDDLSPPAPT
jgi:hypothetical protein